MTRAVQGPAFVCITIALHIVDFLDGEVDWNIHNRTAVVRHVWNKAL
jgi:hypothetical protein